MEKFIQKRRFTRAGNAGDDHELRKRNIDIEIFDIEFRAAADLELAAISRAPLFRHFDLGFFTQVRACARAGFVGLCGEMASDPVLAFILLGLGLDEMSMSASSILKVKKMIRGLRYTDVLRVTQEAMGLSSGSEIEEYVAAQLYRLLPNL